MTGNSENPNERMEWHPSRDVASQSRNGKPFGSEETAAEQQTPPELEAKLPKIIQFDSLARCGEEVWIENGGQIYRLRRTRQGKLILTK